MARKPDARLAQAEEMYRDGMRLVDIAERLGLPAGTVRRWKCTYGWDNERSEKKVNARKEGDARSGMKRRYFAAYRRCHPHLHLKGLTDEQMEVQVSGEYGDCPHRWDAVRPNVHKVGLSAYRRDHPHLNWMTDDELALDMEYCQAYPWMKSFVFTQRWDWIREKEAGAHPPQEPPERGRNTQGTQRACDLFGWG